MMQDTTDAPTAERLFIPLPGDVDAGLAADIEKQSVYVAEDIVSMKVHPAERRVLVECKHGSDAQAIAAKVGRFLEAMLKEFRKIDTKVHFERKRKDASPLSCGVFEELLQRGWAYSHGSGQVSLAGPALRLMNEVDARFRELYQSLFDLEERSYPAMLKASVLARCGYFEMHPNTVSFVSHLMNDFDEIESFRKANEGKNHLCVTHGDAFSEPHYCLNPAACFPCYESFEGKRLNGEGQILTWVGRVFRYESGNIRGLDRLWEFNVRELVFLGTDAFVKEGRRAALDLVRLLAEEWDLDCRIETATDPFFASVHAAKTFWQKALDVKSEIRLAIEPDADGSARTIAAGSVNLHGPFFGERFNITHVDGGPAHSACVGWGLERWVLALFSQHGFEPSRWPQSLRKNVFG